MSAGAARYHAGWGRAAAAGTSCGVVPKLPAQLASSVNAGATITPAKRLEWRRRIKRDTVGNGGVVRPAVGDRVEQLAGRVAVPLDLRVGEVRVRDPDFSFGVIERLLVAENLQRPRQTAAAVLHYEIGVRIKRDVADSRVRHGKQLPVGRARRELEHCGRSALWNE